MVVGLFGGTFDPIHVGHVKLAEQFLSGLGLDEVWFLVTPQNPWKADSNLTADDLRLEIVRKALEKHDGLVASDYEFHLPKPSYSYQTLRHLRADFPDTEFVLLIGADNWVKFSNWAEHEEILANHRIAVYPRPGYDVNEAELPDNVTVVRTELYDISSTEIRRRLHEGLSVESLVPDEILPILSHQHSPYRIGTRSDSTSRTAVIILNWNGASMLRRYLPSVVANSGDAEVWVADNASTDDSLQILKEEFPSVKTFVMDKNYGFAEGYNQAIRHIEADYVVLLNSDVRVTPDWLAPLQAFLDNNPDTVALQPKILKDGGNENEDEKNSVNSVNSCKKNADEKLRLENLCNYFPLVSGCKAQISRNSLKKNTDSCTPPADESCDRFEYAGASGGFVDMFGYPYCRGRLFDSVEKDHHQYDEPMEVHWATGACLMIRREDYLRSGGLDGRFFAHNEEIDLCWRLRIAGKKIMCLPQSRVYHLGGGTLPQGNPRKTYLNFRNNLTMLYKNLPQSSLHRVLFVRAVLDYVAALQSLLKGNIGDVKAIFKARRDYKRWRHDFDSDRAAIQQRRVLNPADDLSPFSLLVQYYLCGKRKWRDLPLN